MNEKKRKASQQQYQDMAVSILLDSYTELDVDEVIEEYEALEEEGAIDVPDELVQKCRQRVHRALAKEHTRKLLKKVVKATAKVAMFFLMFIGIITVAAVSVEAVRIPLISFVIESFDDHVSIHIQDEKDEVESTPEVVFRRLDQVLPAEYSIKLKEYMDDGTLYVKYHDQKGGKIVLQTYTNHSVANMDSNESGTYPMELNGKQALYIKKDGLKIVWTDEEIGVVFGFFANNLSEEVFWVMSEYISK